ncbi:MAG: DUF2889 domain-containing protein [Betaproteobacteria bacterium]
MPLASPSSIRQRLHQRSITVDGYKREDGLWDIEARLVDAKDHVYPLSTGVRNPGEAVHDMSVRVTIDSQMNVVDVVTCTDAAPYLGACDSILPEYSEIVGLNLFKGFLKAVKDRFGHEKGCAHVTELLMFVPTVALQTFASEMLDNDEGEDKPFQLDRCHALVSHSETVRRYYPRWYRVHSPEVEPA